MAKITSKSVEESAAARMTRLGVTPASSGHRIAVPPAAAPVTAASAAPTVQHYEEPVAAAVTVTATKKKDKEQRLCIIVSREQALKVKRYALENDTTVSDLLRGFIDSL